MKKINSILFVSFILSLTSIDAQVNIGLTGGILFADMVQDEMQISDIKSHNNFTAGIHIERKILGNFSARMEVRYSKKGGNPTMMDPNFTNTHFRFTYWEIPLHIKYTFGNKIKTYVFSGPALGINTKSTLNTDILDYPFSGKIKNITQKHNYTVDVGMGITHHVSRLILFVECRYTISLTNIIKNGESDLQYNQLVYTLEIIQEQVLKTRDLQLLVGISIPL